MNEKQRLYRALNRQKLDRPPVICPGGMMSAAVTGVLDNVLSNHNEDSKSMTMVSKNIYDKIGFENYGVPYCLTVEAEEMGALVDYGNKKTEARVLSYNPISLEEMIKTWTDNNINIKRSDVVTQAVSYLKNDDIPVIGNISGHISVATSIYEPVDVFKLFNKNPELMKKYLDIINEYLKDFAMRLIKNGADVIAISDPTSTGEILGAKNFAKFSLPVYKDLIHFIHKEGIPVILHICGAANGIVNQMEETGADALSFDSIVSIKNVKEKVNTPVMGNVSTQLLTIAREDQIRRATNYAMDSLVDIVAPACGIGMETKVSNLKTMVCSVKERD